MFDEDGSATFDEAVHATLSSRNLYDSLDDLHCTSLLVDDDREGRSLDHGSKHRSLDGKVRDSGVLDLEQHCAQRLDDACKPTGLCAGWKAQFAMRCNEDIVSSPHEGCATALSGQ